MKHGKFLLRDKDKGLFYIIPSHVDIPHGSDDLYSIEGKKIKVRLDLMNEFEVTKQEANRWLIQEFKGVMSQLDRGLKKWFSRSTPERGLHSSAYDESGKRENIPSSGLDLLADITDSPREGMDNNYSAIGDALKVYLKDIKDTVVDVASGDEERKQQASRRMKAWARTLEKHGISPNNTKSSEPND